MVWVAVASARVEVARMFDVPFNDLLLETAVVAERLECEVVMEVWDDDVVLPCEELEIFSGPFEVAGEYHQRVVTPTGMEPIFACMPLNSIVVETETGSKEVAELSSLSFPPSTYRRPTKSYKPTSSR